MARTHDLPARDPNRQRGVVPLRNIALEVDLPKGREERSIIRSPISVGGRCTRTGSTPSDLGGVMTSRSARSTPWSASSSTFVPLARPDHRRSGRHARDATGARTAVHSGLEVDGWSPWWWMATKGSWIAKNMAATGHDMYRPLPHRRVGVAARRRALLAARAPGRPMRQGAIARSMSAIRR